MLKPNELVACLRCGRKEAVKFRDYFNKVCKECRKDPKYIKEQAKKKEMRSKEKRIVATHLGYKEPVAFGHDIKTGRPLAIDKKGNKFDPGKTRYNLARDPHGWKATKGKNKLRKSDKYGRPNYL